MKKKKIGWTVIIVIIVIWVIGLLIPKSTTVALPGEGVMRVTLGSVANKTFRGQLVWKWPVIAHFERYNIWQDTLVKTINVRTKDLQLVSIKYIATYNPTPDSCHIMFGQVGYNFLGVKLVPVIEDVIPKIIGGYNEWVFSTGREDMRTAVLKIVQDILVKENLLQLPDFRFADIKFSPEFEDALNRKSVAAQDTLVAMYQSITVREKARQALMMKTAEAQGLKLAADAVNGNPFIVNYKFAESLGNVNNLTLFNGVPTAAVLPILNSGATPKK